MSCSPTEPVEKHDDTSVLQDFINISSGTLLTSLDTDNSGAIEPLELGIQKWENGRILELNCYSIGLTGEIPESIGNLTELTQLGLKNNNLNGEIPESIGNLTKLTQLNLADNALSGSIPYTIGNLKSLTNLVLSNNEFTGSIPSIISNLTILHTFLADSNNFSGTIPDEICTIYPNFIDYNLAYNKFCPPLPECIDAPEEAIKYQDCNCETGYNLIDGYCYSETDLKVLQTMIDNSLFSSPDSLRMSMDADTSLVIEPLELGFQKWSGGRLETLDCHWLDTASCNLSITIPDNIDDLDSLKFLNLQDNNLSGKIPDGLGDLSILEDLNLQDNNLTGGIPETINGLPKLVTLNLKDNKLGCNDFDPTNEECITHCNDDDTDVCSGYVSENICNIETIEDIYLSNNMLCPCYPECIDENNIGIQDKSDCSYCNEGYTQICDNLPEFVTIEEGDSLCFKTDNLAVLDTFIYNSLNTLPDNLDVSMLADSTDTIQDIEPLELGEQTWANGKLMIFNAINRGFSGSIPHNIGSLDSLFFLYISDNYLSGELPDSIYKLINLYSLHLSGNQLSGEISPSICDLTIDNWEIDGTHPNRSYLDNNKFCPGEGGYPVCIEPYVGEQDTTECDP